MEYELDKTKTRTDLQDTIVAFSASKQLEDRNAGIIEGRVYAGFRSFFKERERKLAVLRTRWTLLEGSCRSFLASLTIRNVT